MTRKEKMATWFAHNICLGMEDVPITKSDIRSFYLAGFMAAKALAQTAVYESEVDPTGVAEEQVAMIGEEEVNE